MRTRTLRVHRTVSASRHASPGQIALIVMLLMAVVLTVGLSIASRSVMDVSLSRQEEEGSMTFQAAESGIEAALNQDFASITTDQTIDLGTVGSCANVRATISPRNTIETTVEQGGSVQVRTSATGGAKNLNIDWGRGPSCSSSLLIRVYNLTSGAYTARNYAVGCGGGNNFTTTGTSAGLNNYTRRYTVGIVAGDEMVSIQVLGADTALSVTSGTVGWTLPTQYFSILSRAVNNCGNEQRSIMVTRTAAGHPGILDYTLYSGTTVAK